MTAGKAVPRGRTTQTTTAAAAQPADGAGGPAVPAESDFGLSSARLCIETGARLDHVLFDALCLLDCALATFEVLEEAGDVHAAHHAGLYLLRQARIALAAGQISPAQAAALATRS